MDYEKEYKEICQQLIAAYNTTSFIEVRKAIEKIHPELKENEDERIRKRIIEILNRLPGYYWYGQKEKDDILAYLEKQKEPHYTKRNAVFDKCVENCDPGVMKNVSDEVDEMLQKEQNPERINITEMVAKYRITDEYVEGEYKGKPVNCMIRAYEQGIRDALLKVKKQKLTEDTAVQKAFVNSKKDYTLEEKCDASDYADTILPTSVTYGENDEEYKLHKIIEAAFIAGKKMAQKPAEYEKPLLSKFERAVYDCAWDKVTCKLEGETQEEYAKRWAEHLLLMVRDWADDYIDFQIESAKRKAYDKGKADAEKPAEWSEEDENTKNHVLGYLNGFSCSEEAKQQMWKWINSLPERFNLQPKQEWSEEDEKMLSDCIEAVGSMSVRSDVKTLRDWLKSLRPQPHWKPSEEQMRALKHFIGPSVNGAIVGELYDELEKL